MVLIKAITARPDCTEQEMELFFLYCSPNMAFMTIALFLIVRRVKISSPKLVKTFTHITKCGLGIYLVHYFVVDLGYAVSDALLISISIKIPVTAVFVFLISWAFVAFFYKLTPKASKWIFG